MEDTRRPIRDHLPLAPEAEELSKLLDSLVALRLQIANAPKGEPALGAKLVEARAALETAIEEVKRLLEQTDRRHHSSKPNKSDGHRPQQGGAGHPMPIFDPADAPDPEQVYANYLRSCVMAGIEPVPRDEDAV